MRASLLAFALTLLPVLAWAQTEAGTYRVTSELNIRAAPSIDAGLIGVIPPSEQITVFACDAFGWCQVRYRDIDGWAARQFLVRTGDLPTDTFALRFGTSPREDGAIELHGEFTPGTPCGTLRTDDGAYALLGNVAFNPVDPIHVVGRPITSAICGTDTALAVLYVRLDR